MTNDVFTPIKWRKIGTKPQSAGTLFEFVRVYLSEQGGECRRAELLAAMKAMPQVSKRLARSQGFVRILWNMRNSGWITLEHDRVIETRKSARKVCDTLTCALGGKRTSARNREPV